MASNRYSGQQTCSPAAPVSPDERDSHSYSDPWQCRIGHIHLDLTPFFDSQVLEGTVTLVIASRALGCKSLVLDTRDLVVRRAEVSREGQHYSDTDLVLGQRDAILGAPLIISLKDDTTHVRVHYATTPQASGLQWLEPAQTATREHPFLFAQSQAIHARSWMPIQDTPGVRVTFSARIQTPPELRAVMGGEQMPPTEPGVFDFRMNHAIPAYLIALAIGRLEFAETGRRTGVFAEPPLIESAAAEFADTETMIQAAERLYGPYRWGRFDLLVLPPSFPFGGMENPCVAFITPTVISGDRSLISLISHELAHSWSGNLVTNAAWGDFWLNEGFTTYIEHRIQESIYGEERAEMEAALALHTLEEEMADLEARDQILHVDLSGRDPDEGCTTVPYVKGALFLRMLEQIVGRSRLDHFLKRYFDHFAFKSITTAEALDYLKRELVTESAEWRELSIEEWVFRPGLPASAPRTVSAAFLKVEEAADDWLKANLSSSEISTANWSALEWLHFLDYLPEHLGNTRMQELDRAFDLTNSRNNEILQK